MLKLAKFSLVIVTRCNLRCRLCCEYVPQNKPFPDMTVEEAKEILSSAFAVIDRIGTLHLTGGGEPFLHPKLAQLIETSMEYQDRFDRLMLFTNSTIPIPDELLGVMKRYREKILVQTSLYHVKPDREEATLKLLTENGVACKVEKYYGDDQSFGGWVDFGGWEPRHRTPEELERVFHTCSVTQVLQGNWRTRDGKVHWCTRSQRGMELGLLPDNPDDYVDLLDRSESREVKRTKFAKIENAKYISACDCCSGDAGTSDHEKRYPAAEQL
ncbi:radical SAM protein [Bacillota bacterium Meth-B3]